jgi:hypothetical protein
MNTRESSERSTPPREDPEPEPEREAHREEMDTCDGPTGELHQSRQQSGSETAGEIRMRSGPEDADEEPPSDDYNEPLEQPSIRAVRKTTSLC